MGPGMTPMECGLLLDGTELGQVSVCSLSLREAGGFASCESCKPSCVVVSVTVGVAAARRYQLACQALLSPIRDALYFHRRELPHRVQRASCCCLNVCLGYALMHH